MSFSGGKGRRFRRSRGDDAKIDPRPYLKEKLQGVVLAILLAVGAKFEPVVRRRVATWIRALLIAAATWVGMDAAEHESAIATVAGFAASLAMAGFAMLWSFVEKHIDGGEDAPVAKVREEIFDAEVVED